MGIKTRTFLAATVFACSTWATTITATFSQVSPSGTIERSLDSGTNWGQYNIGRFIFTFSSMPPGVSFEGTATTFIGFCVEPLEGVTVGNTYSWTLATLDQGATNIGGMGATRADQIARLLSAALPSFTGTITNLQASALQIAIWEIVRETSGTLNVTNGTVRFRNESVAGTLTQAQTWLNMLSSTNPPAPLTNLGALIQTGVQDIVVQYRGTPVPEPSAWVMLGLAGLLGVFGSWRRSKKASALNVPVEWQPGAIDTTK
jgi:hypothetical protein